MGRSVREEYDEYAAAGRLRVPVAAWRWATGSGLVPPADAGTRLWSRAVVEAADPEAVRAALRGPVGAGWAADRLTEALGVPLPILRPRVTASAVGRLVKAGLLVYLGGDVEFPDVHPDQVAALARRRDLPALLDRHVPLGPDQAARRLGVRRVDFDQVVWLGWVAPVGSVEIDYKHHGGVTTVPLYSAEEVALLPVVRPSVDWRAVYAARAGTRSPLAALDASPVWERVLLAGVARIARVGRAAVVNWRRRHGDFPAPVAGTDVHPQFDSHAVVAWLLAHDKIGVPSGPTVAPLVLAGTGGATRRFRLDDPHLVLADDPAWEDVLSGWSTDTDADTVAELVAGEFGASLRRLTAPGTNPLAVMGEVRVIDRFRSGSGGLRLTLAWWNRWRRLASLTLPLRQLLRSCVGRKVRLGWESVMAWSIAEVARMSGVTSRTLRHYCPDLHQPKAQLPHHKDPLQPQQLALS
ncbi:hypothetical protein [Streptomyces sp. NPDC091259]|uniref:hypothetical protein n=1 Tax=Streptomyces sp. NPDC091259 TaxID=3365976 RepID=UPI00380BB1D2